jgi:hypothetical protein
MLRSPSFQQPASAWGNDLVTFFRCNTVVKTGRVNAFRLGISTQHRVRRSVRAVFSGTDHVAVVVLGRVTGIDRCQDVLLLRHIDGEIMEACNKTSGNRSADRKEHEACEGGSVWLWCGHDIFFLGKLWLGMKGMLRYTIWKKDEKISRAPELRSRRIFDSLDRVLAKNLFRINPALMQ